MNNIKESSFKPNDKTPSWTFVDAWNETLDDVERYPAYERDNMWASELGKSLVDVWLAMNGIEASNPFDARSKRKFDAGVMWEWIAELAAKRAGIFIDSQGRTSHNIDGLCSVTGKYDLKLGGEINTEMIKKMRDALEIISFPDRFIKAMEAVEKSFKIGDKLPVRILEVKSSSAYMYDSQYKLGIPSENHALQCLHYLISEGIDEGAVLYISKDDCRMTEIPIWRDDTGLNARYLEFVTELSKYYKGKKQPPKEPSILFNEDQGKFTDNWNIKYSAYLTHLYGWAHESTYQDNFKSKIASWNRVVGRIKRGEKMTKSNLEYIEEIKKEFPNFDDLVLKFRDKAVENHEEGYVVEEK